MLWCSPIDLHKYRLIRCGALREQDRSSCMSVAALAPQPGWTVADACAAPGNKTTQAAAYVGATGSVLACERDPRRFEILEVLPYFHVHSHRSSRHAVAVAFALIFASLMPVLPPLPSGNHQQNEMRKHPRIQR